MLTFKSTVEFTVQFVRNSCNGCKQFHVISQMTHSSFGQHSFNAPRHWGRLLHPLNIAALFIWFVRGYQAICPDRGRHRLGWLRVNEGGDPGCEERVKARSMCKQSIIACHAVKFEETCNRQERIKYQLPTAHGEGESVLNINDPKLLFTSKRLSRIIKWIELEICPYGSM